MWRSCSSVLHILKGCHPRRVLSGIQPLKPMDSRLIPAGMTYSFFVMPEACPRNVLSRVFCRASREIAISEVFPNICHPRMLLSGIQPLNPVDSRLIPAGMTPLLLSCPKGFVGHPERVVIPECFCRGSSLFKSNQNINPSTQDYPFQ